MLAEAVAARRRFQDRVHQDARPPGRRVGRGEGLLCGRVLVEGTEALLEGVEGAMQRQGAPVAAFPECTQGLEGAPDAARDRPRVGEVDPDVALVVLVLPATLA